MVRKITSGTAKAKCWVKARQIKRVTGWSDKEMFEARKRGWITWEYTEADGFNYDLNSLNQYFLKSPNHAQF